MLSSSSPTTFSLHPKSFPTWCLSPLSAPWSSSSPLNPAKIPLPPGRLPAFQTQIKGPRVTPSGTANGCLPSFPRTGFPHLLLHSVFQEPTLQCRKPCSSVSYNHSRNAEVEATSPPGVGEGAEESVLRRGAIRGDSQVLVDVVEIEPSSCVSMRENLDWPETEAWPIQDLRPSR